MNINECALPQKYVRNGKECYLDPVRKKLIYVTPEGPSICKNQCFLSLS